MSRIIVVSNETSVLSDTEAAAGVAAVQKQIDSDFAPAYSGLRADLAFWPKSKGKPAAGVEILHLLDNATVADALGYHELNAGGYPEGFVFVKTTMDAGDPWQATFSHEALEQLLDPFANWTLQAKLGNSGVWVALESCDAVENDTYAIDGLEVSNFVLPAWFRKGPGPWDHLGKLLAPLTLDSGGYIAYADSAGNWHQIMGRAYRGRGPARYSRQGRYLLHTHLASRCIRHIPAVPTLHTAALSWTTIQGILAGILKVAPSVLAVIETLVGALPVTPAAPTGQLQPA